MTPQEMYDAASALVDQASRSVESDEEGTVLIAVLIGLNATVLAVGAEICERLDSHPLPSPATKDP